MRIYKISCYSDSGTYFQAYLKSVTILAGNEAEAVDIVNRWQMEKGRHFISPDVEIEDLGSCLVCVVDYDCSSDY